MSESNLKADMARYETSKRQWIRRTMKGTAHKTKMRTVEISFDGGQRFYASDGYDGSRNLLNLESEKLWKAVVQPRLAALLIDVEQWLEREYDKK